MNFDSIYTYGTEIGFSFLPFFLKLFGVFPGHLLVMGIHQQGFPGLRIFKLNQADIGQGFLAWVGDADGNQIVFLFCLLQCCLIAIILKIRN